MTVSKKNRFSVETLSAEEISQELYLLLSTATDAYQQEVVMEKKDYRFFVSEFIALHYEVDGDAAHRNAHRRNREILEKILTERVSLAMHFLFGGTFSEEMFKDLMAAYYSPRKGSKIARTTSSASNVPLVSPQHPLDDRQIVLITQLAKENNLFLVDNITEEHIKSLFYCKPGFHLRVGYLSGFCLLLDRLSVNGVLHRRWQNILAKKHLVLSKEDGHPLKANTFSTALSKARWSCSEATYKVRTDIDKYFPKTQV